LSKLLGKSTVIVPTDLGAMSVVTEVVVDYDIEDIIQRKSESQALVIQMANAGRNMKPKAYSNDVLPSIYTTTLEDLEDG
jgi:hypothetical protein